MSSIDKGPRQPDAVEIRDRDSVLAMYNDNLAILEKHPDDAEITVRADSDKSDGQHFTQYHRINVGDARRFLRTKLEELQTQPATSSVFRYEMQGEVWSEISEVPPGAKVEKTHYPKER